MVLPVVDSFLPETEQYLPRDPTEVLQTGNYATMPVLTGTTRHEGAATLCGYQNRTLLNFHSVYAIFLYKSLRSLLRLSCKSVMNFFLPFRNVTGCESSTLKRQRRRTIYIKSDKHVLKMLTCNLTCPTVLRYKFLVEKNSIFPTKRQPSPRHC